jgi:hypothetical protein
MTEPTKVRSERGKRTTAIATQIIHLCGEAYPKNPAAACDAVTTAMLAMVVALKGEEAADALRQHLSRFIEQRVRLESGRG